RRQGSVQCAEEVWGVTSIQERFECPFLPSDSAFDTERIGGERIDAPDCHTGYGSDAPQHFAHLALRDRKDDRSDPIIAIEPFVPHERSEALYIHTVPRYREGDCPDSNGLKPYIGDLDLYRRELGVQQILENRVRGQRK